MSNFLGCLKNEFIRKKLGENATQNLRGVEKGVAHPSEATNQFTAG
jgi:hypothetical protein